LTTMVTQLAPPKAAISEERVLLPGYYSWSQFEAIAPSFADILGLRVTYLDGYIELMTTGELHEKIKTMLGFLIETYFVSMEIEYEPVGNATRSDRDRKVSFEPDESYYIGDKGKHPNLAIEVIITSGTIDKLEKYKRLQIEEVWFWESDRLSVYHLQGESYQAIDRSQILPDLDIDLLVRCVKMDSRVAAGKTFCQSLPSN